MNRATDKALLIVKLEKAIAECEKHAKRSNYALTFIKDMFPLTISSYQSFLEHEEAIETVVIKNSMENRVKDNIGNGLENRENNTARLEYLDLFLYRYTKLQDKIGTSIIRPLSDLLEYNTETQSFIDCLNIIERYEVIESVEVWDNLRTLRNSIAHDYSDDLEYQVQVLNSAFSNYNTLLTIFQNIKDKLAKIKGE